MVTPYALGLPAVQLMEEGEGFQVFFNENQSILESPCLPVAFQAALKGFLGQTTTIS